MVLEKNKIVADSSCDLTPALKKKLNIGLVALKINVNKNYYVDDENILEQSKEKFIHVFDSLSASIGETLISMKINELIEKKFDKFDIIEEVEGYIEDMKTFFVLESLDNLVKAGRISKLLSHIGSILSIKPIMGANDDGTIRLVEKTRGKKRAFKRLVEVIGEQGEKLEEKILGIAHCNAPEKAEKLKKQIEEMYNFKEVIIVETAGLSSAYANDGGIIIAF